MSALVNAAASVTPPVQEDNIFVVAGTAASQSAAIPDAWRNQYITIFADGDAFHVAFGDSAVAVDETAVTTITSASSQTFDGDECVKIPENVGRDYDMRKIGADVTHFAWKGSGTSGYIRIERSSGFAA